MKLVQKNTTKTVSFCTVFHLIAHFYRNNQLFLVGTQIAYIKSSMGEGSECEICQNQYVDVEFINNRIALLKINRSKDENAINMNIVHDLKEHIIQLKNNENVQCVVITGHDKYFATGTDVHELKGLSVSEAYQYARQLKALYKMIATSPKPFIAAIQGYCLGAGLELALACDIRIADQSAKFGFPEVDLGIIPGNGGIQRLIDLTGHSIASQFLMTGEIIDAYQAKNLRLINFVAENVLKSALHLAEKIAEKSSHTISVIKKLVRQKQMKTTDVDLDSNLYEFALLFDYSDSFEGISAYLENRRPIFQENRREK